MIGDGDLKIYPCFRKGFFNHTDTNSCIVTAPQVWTHPISFHDLWLKRFNKFTITLNLIVATRGQETNYNVVGVQYVNHDIGDVVLSCWLVFSGMHRHKQNISCSNVLIDM